MLILRILQWSIFIHHELDLLDSQPFSFWCLSVWPVETYLYLMWIIPVADGWLLQIRVCVFHWGADGASRFWYDSNGLRLNREKAAGFLYVRRFLKPKRTRKESSHCPSTFPIYHSQRSGKLLAGLIIRSVKLLLCSLDYKPGRCMRLKPLLVYLCCVNKTCKILSMQTLIREHVWFHNEMQGNAKNRKNISPSGPAGPEGFTAAWQGVCLISNSFLWKMKKCVLNTKQY